MAYISPTLWIACEYDNLLYEIADLAKSQKHGDIRYAGDLQASYCVPRSWEAMRPDGSRHRSLVPYS